MSYSKPYVPVISGHIYNGAIHANGDREGFLPRSFRWLTMPLDSGRHLYFQETAKRVWWTDGYVPNKRYSGTQVVLLLEPRCLHPENYVAVERAVNAGFVDWLFTHDATFIPVGTETGYKRIVYPLGGTRIHSSDWGNWHSKSKHSSIIASDKRGLPGHALRHEIIQTFPGIDAYGPSYKPFESKLEALAEYKFSVVTECCDSPLFFSEHLLDCFLTGTIPVYWSKAQRVAQYWGFDLGGMIPFDTVDDLFEIAFPEWSGNHRLHQARLRNLERALWYTCPEDWIARMFPELFVGDPFQ